VNLPTAITGRMTLEQVEAYAMHVRIQEITHKLRIDNIVPTDRVHRSPSPEPQYDSAGRRTNTRYQRHRERLENERHSLIHTAMRIIPNYRAPQGYVHRAGRPFLKEKVYIPAKDFPEVNFIGQLLGPRGRSLADLNTRSEATIAIRGKGSVKDGRARERGRQISYKDQDEPLHCLIMADTREKVDRAKELVLGVIEIACTTPEQANTRKRDQLRALAITNGTFRDDEAQEQSGYYSRGPSAGAVLTSCTRCGGGGHILRDCLHGPVSAPWRRVPPWRMTVPTQTRIDDATEVGYRELMREIEGPGSEP